MANKTQMTIIRGEVFTKDKPGYVELVNPPEQDEQIKTIINKLSQVTTNQSAQTGVLETIKETLTNDELETLIKVLGVSRNILNTQQEIQDTLTQLKERLDEPIPTQLTGSNVVYKRINISINNVESGKSEMKSIYSPQNTISRVLNASIRIPKYSNASNGTHTFELGTYELSNGLHAKQSFDKNIWFNYGYFYTVGQALPETPQHQLELLKSLVFSETIPLVIAYANNTDADTDGTTYISFIVEERKII